MAFRYLLAGRELTAPAGACVGLIGDDRESQQKLLASDPGVWGLDQPRLSPFELRKLVVEIARASHAGRVVLVATEDERLLRECDELWWIEGGELRAQGDPREVWPVYQREAAQRFREWASVQNVEWPASFRAGDGRAALETVEPVDAAGAATQVWQSGEHAGIRVLVRFQAAVAKPVVGIMIRSRLGLEVYGTNTELEKLELGPVEAGAALEIQFGFVCRLAPQEYTITAASHDPDGVWHDWMEDAVAVSVADTRYTAGVVNLAATVSCRRYGQPR